MAGGGGPGGPGTQPGGAAATVAELVSRRAGDDAPALVFEGHTWTWAEVVAEANARARWLAGWSDDEARPRHLGILAENGPEFVFLLFGAALAGTTVVGLNTTRRGAELARDVTHTDCRVVVADTAGCARLREAGVESAGVTVLDLDAGQVAAAVTEAADAGAVAEPGAVAEAAPGPTMTAPRPESLYLLLFTSGSTGAPKAVRMSQGRAARTAADSARAFGPDNVLYCTMPLFHGNALLTNLFPALIVGARVVLRRRFSASAFATEVREHGCTFFNYVGRSLAYILAVPESPDDADNRLRWALGSEAPLPVRREFTRRFGCPIFEGYGSSENAVVISPAPGCPPGALGRPRAGTEVAIIDPDSGGEQEPARFDADGRLLNPATCVGEIVGRNVLDRFEGYYDNPEAQAERARDGWYWTGDLGYRDEEGWIYFAGRRSDWLRVDGENFSAASVEEVLVRYPGASGVVVYGVPDPVSGDCVMAALEIRGGTFDPDDFAAFLSSQADLGTKSSPRFVRVLEELPVTATAKPDRMALRAVGWRARAVWWKPERTGPYVAFDAAARQSLEADFARHGRTDRLPGGSATG